MQFNQRRGTCVFRETRRDAVLRQTRKLVYAPCPLVEPAVMVSSGMTNHVLLGRYVVLVDLVFYGIEHSVH